MVFVAGQIGWDESGKFPDSSLTGQIGQTLQNTLAVLAEADAGPQHITRMTWYITSRSEYLDEVREIGKVWREVMGKHYPAMAVVQVVALIESSAKVEIETTAVVPNDQ